MAWLNPRDLWMWEHAQGGTDAVPSTEHRSQYGIPAGATSFQLDHGFHTSAVSPAFNPSWNTQVRVVQITDSNISVAFSVAAPPLPTGSWLDYSIDRTGSSTAVASGDTTATITHNLGDATAVILLSLTWFSNIRIVSKSANSMAVSFANTAFGAQTIYWGSHRGSLDVSGSLEAVTGDRRTHTITHSLGHAFAPSFFLPSWNTTVKATDKGETQTVLFFSTDSPTGGGQLDYLVKSP